MTPKKYPQNLHTPKIYSFSETPKNIEIQDFEPSLRMCENIRVPPPPGGWANLRKKRENEWLVGAKNKGRGRPTYGKKRKQMDKLGLKTGGGEGKPKKKKIIY